MLRIAQRIARVVAFVLIGWGLCAGEARAQTATVRPTGPETLTLASELEMLEDASGAATLADVMGPLRNEFRPVGTDRPTFGVSRGAAWTRVKVDLSADPKRATRRAQFSALHPDTASFFIVDEAGNMLRAYHGGLDVVGSNVARRFSMSIGDIDAERFTLYARVTTHYKSTLTQFLITAEEEARTEIAVERVIGPLFGAMLLAVLFCLLLWVHLRERQYGYGFAVVLSIFITAQPHMNLDRVFWPAALQDGDITRFVYLGGSSLVHAFGVMFTSYFLAIPERSPRLHRLASASAIAIGAGMALTALLTPHDFLTVLMAGMALVVIVITAMVADAVRARRRAALMYVVVAAPFLICLLLTNLASYHAVTAHPISTSLAVIGLTFLVVGITLGLADGFRQNLEAKVRERTAELSIANAALREAHEAKNRMLGIVAHDLRNPLSGIRAAAQLLIDVPLTAEKRDTLVRAIRDGADVTLGMTEDLLDVAAIRDGRVDLVPDVIDLSRLVESRAELLRITAQAKNIQLILDLARIPPVWADAKRAAQVLDNLVSNAVKYSPYNGEVRIELRAVDGRARLAVTDQGEGIAAEELSEIFEPFGRASTRPTGGERSTGLGLAIVKRLAEAQDGEIRVESAPGRGSRFELFLPFATSVARPPR